MKTLCGLEGLAAREAAQEHPTPREALTHARSVIQEVAASTTFYPEGAAGTMDALERVRGEELELFAAIAAGDAAATADELGDLFFAVVRVAHAVGVDAGWALTAATAKYQRRMEEVRRLVALHRVDPTTASPEVWRRLWRLAKEATGHPAPSLPQTQAERLRALRAYVEGLEDSHWHPVMIPDPRNLLEDLERAERDMEEAEAALRVAVRNHRVALERLHYASVPLVRGASEVGDVEEPIVPMMGEE